jgi:hypothetical protein
VLGFAFGYVIASAVHVAAELGIADLMKDAPRSHEELAATTRTDASSLLRLLRLLVSHGLLTEERDGRFSLTAIGACLRQDSPDSMRDTVLWVGGRMHRDWLDLLYCLESGQPAFRRAGMADYFTRLSQHPNEAAIFDRGQARVTRAFAAALAASYDFSRFGTIVDVGGGTGLLLEALLANNPGLRGTLFDLEHVVERARTRLAGTAVADRCTFRAGDFFREVPEGADAYLSMHVIHDWDDAAALKILEVCRSAMHREARLLVFEAVYPAQIEPSDIGRNATMVDMNLLVSTGGRQRTVAEFETLYAAAGFEVSRVATILGPTVIIEGRPR